MKVYLAIFIVIVIAGFSVLGVIIYNGAPVHYYYNKKLETVYLNTANMKEAGNNVLDSIDGPGLVAVFLCNKTNADNAVAPWADLYVCKSYNKIDSLLGDTLIILLDTHTKASIGNVSRPADYWTGVKAGKKYKQCKVLIPQGELDSLKNYRYKYGSVTLITDDNN